MIQILFIIFSFFHPFYVGVSEVKYNAQSKKMEIACKLFYDDLEYALQQETGKKIDVLKPANKAELDLLIKNYLLAHFNIVVNTKNIPLEYIGYELQEDAVWCYMESGKVSSVKQLQVTNSLLYKYFKTQLHIISADVNGMKQSKKINNPKKDVVFDFKPLRN